MTLHDYLISHRMSQAAFAKRIGVTQGAVSRYCAGRVPSSPQLIQIARVTKGEVGLADFALPMAAEVVEAAQHQQV